MDLERILGLELTSAGEYEVVLKSKARLLSGSRGRDVALESLMAYSPTAAPLLLWLTPALLALLLYGLGQGFVKMWITEVPPARFCLYFACARALVMACYFFANPHTPVLAAGSSMASCIDGSSVSWPYFCAMV